MSRPVIGVVANSHTINDDYYIYGGGEMMTEVVSDVCGALPLLVPVDPCRCDLPSLMATCDGFLLPGGRPNVHPEEYGEEETDAHGTFNRNRDRLVLPLVRACVDVGQPIFGICLGFQEVNVAMGGTLYPEIRDLPGRMNHRMPPDGTLEEKFALRHDVTFTKDGPFHRLVGARTVRTNTLHGQGIKVPGPRIVIDGRAEDDTPEAIYVKDAPGFALAVQWHAEYRAGEDPVSKPLFEAFGAAAQDWAAGKRPARLKSA